MIRYILVFAIVATTLFIPKLSNATMGWDIGRVRTGFILTRGVVLSESGNIIYSYYNADGTTSGDIGEAVGPLEGAKVISGEEYNAIYNYYQQIKAEHGEGIAKGAYIMSAEEYSQKEFFTVNGEKVHKSPLLPGVKSVYVRADSQLLIPENDPSLVQAQINLNDASAIGSNIRSVLLNNEGSVHTASERTIGPKTEQHSGALRPGDEPEGAVSGTLVEVLAPFGSATITDKNGYFAAPYALYPCPGVQVFSSTGTIIYFGMRNFNPKGVPVLNYPMIFMHYDSDFCSGLGAITPGFNLSGVMAQVAVIGIEATISHPVVPLRYYLDINVINGEGYLSNDGVSPLAVGTTEYEYEAPSDDPIVQTEYDFDGDNISENAVLGKIVQDNEGEDKFTTCNVSIEEQEYQGIYLSSGNKQPNFACGTEDELQDSTQPDFIRLADKAQDFRHQGLLKGISEDDFKDTDLYVFRESNGMLITERNGLKDSEVSMFDDGGINAGKMFYQMTVRGPKGVTNAIENLQNLSFSGFQSAQQMNPELHAAKSDHLRPFEQIRVVAINRKTGYMGTVRAAFGTGNSYGLITFPISEIVMGPPNLKIKAERQYEIERGMTKGDEKEYLIGYEGASLTSDTIVKITTEWFDVDGSPLPAGLNELGFTGRLAKVVGSNQLVAEGGQLAQFAIKPGYHVEQVKLGGDTSEHYYVQVSPESVTGDPNFGGKANGPGPLQYRPANYVPIKVPLMDETLSWQQFRAYQQLKRDGQAENIPKPKPFYRWYYRPEMQFSMYDLEIESIFTEESNGQEIDIYPMDEPTIGGGDDAVRIAYSIIEQSADALAYLGHGQELIFALGEHEIKAEIGEDKQIRFTNVEHLGKLSPEDFLSMRLYSNNDPGNILWQFAFEYLDIDALIDVDEDYDEDGYIMVSADDAYVDLISNLVGYTSREEDAKYDATIKWVTDAGSLDKYTDTNREYAIFENTLHTSRVAGSQYEVYSVLSGNGNSELSETLQFRVVPGVPAQISIVKSGETSVNGIGNVMIEATIKDAYGNLVDTNAPVGITIEGSLEQLSTDPQLEDGVIKYEFTGTDFAETAIVKIKAGDVEQTVDVEVAPINIQFVTAPADVEVNDTFVAKIKVTDSSGAAVADTTIDVYTETGRVAESQVTTDSTGEASFTFVAPQRPGNAFISARAAFQAKVEHNFNVINPPAAEEGKFITKRGFVRSLKNSAELQPQLDTTELVVVGDQAANGTYSYVRYDGTTINVPYNVQANAQVRGGEGEQLDLNLGSIYKPNRQMISALWMNAVEGNGTVKDEVGALIANATDVARAKGNEHIGGNSLWFMSKENSKIEVENASNILKTDGLSFSIAMQPQEMAGTIVDLSGGLRLELNADGTLTLTANTQNGAVSVQSDAISAAQWSKVAARYHNGELTLWVNGTSFNQNVNGLINYVVPLDDQELVIGEGYKGFLSGLKWFDLTSEPLLTFDGGFEQLTVTIDATGELQVPLIASGKMLANNSQLPMQSVNLVTAQSELDVKLVSLQLYGDLTKYAVAAQLLDSAPPIDENSVYNYQTPPSDAKQISQYLMAQSVAQFVPTAHAYELDFWDMASLLGSLIGLDSLEVIWDQVGNMAMGREVDIVAFSVAVLDVLSLFPPAAPLKIILTPAKLAIKAIKRVNPKAAKYLGGVIKRVYDRLKDRDPTVAFQAIAFFIVAAEMMADAEAREGLLIAMETVTSTEDFMAWVEFFSLADPEIEVESASVVPANDWMPPALRELVAPTANAGVKAALARTIGKSLKKAGPIIKENKDIASPTIRKLTRAALDPSAAGKKIRRVVFKRDMLSGSLAIVKRAGLPKLRNWLLGFNGQRVPPLALITIAAYLETELATNTLFVQGIDSFDSDRNATQLRKLYMESVPAVGNYGGWALNKAYGASFHLMQLAQKRVAANNVLGIEVTRRVPLFLSVSSAAKEKWASAKRFGRRVDIITGTAYHEDETWWEVKSYRAVSKTNREPKLKLTRWSFGKGSANEEALDGETAGPHKEYSLDVVANQIGAYLTDTEMKAKGIVLDDDAPPRVKVTGLHWEFHEFTAGVKKDIVNPSKAELVKKLKPFPKGGDDVYDELGIDENDAKDIVLLGAAKSLMATLKEKGFDLAEEALKDLPEVE